MKPQYELFLSNYIKTRNLTAAARAAGYSEKSAHTQGSRLIKRPDISAAIAAHDAASEKKTAAKAENLAEKVLAELSTLAFSNMQDCFDPATGELLPINLLPRDVAATLTAFENNKGFQKIKTGSKMGALELLSKITQLVKQDQQFQQVQITIAPPMELPERVDVSQLRPCWE